MVKAKLSNMVMIIDRETNKVLVKQNPKNENSISFPGGWVGPKESIIDSAIRQIKEETGLDIKNLKYCGVTNWYNPDDNERSVTFLYKTSDYIGPVLKNKSEVDVFWIELEELNTVNMTEDFEQCLPVFLVENYNEGFARLSKTNQGLMQYK